MDPYANVPDRDTSHSGDGGKERNDNVRTDGGKQTSTQSTEQTEESETVSDANRDRDDADLGDITAGPEDTNGSLGVSDDELSDIVDDQETTIGVVGCGGAGSNTISRMVDAGVSGASLAAVNSDAKHLLQIDAETKVLIGEDETGGRGAGSEPDVGKEAALNSQSKLEPLVAPKDMVFITAGMGGGTGTGAAPVVAELAQEHDALTVSVVTVPFSSEGDRRQVNAEGGIQRLREVSDTVIVVPNDRILDIAPNATLGEAFRTADEVLMRAVKGITELITTAGMVNLDFSDVETVMEDGDVAMIGLGKATGTENQAVEAVENALDSPLLDIDMSTADSILVDVTGSPQHTVSDFEGVVEELDQRVSGEKRIIWGSSVDEDLDTELRTLVLAAGIESPQIYGGDDSDGVEFDTVNGDDGDLDAIDNAEEIAAGADTAREDDAGDIDYIV